MSLTKDSSPEEVRAEWVTRLRSGDYRQGKGELGCRQNEREYFCCLGVLCEMAHEVGIVGREEDEYAVDTATARTTILYGIHDDDYEPGDDDRLEGFDGEGLPLEVMAWSGVDNPMGSFPEAPRVESPDDAHKTLAWENDNGSDFNMIADMIEEKWA